MINDVRPISFYLPHPLFDADFYLGSNPDLSQPDIILEPFAHYMSYGGMEGRDPHPLFDSSFYLDKYPEIANAQINPLRHYLENGAGNGFDPHVLFDTSYYMQQKPDIAKCSFNPLIHYLQFGAKEGFNPHPLFDSSFYLKQTKAEAHDVGNPLIHYLTIGYKQGLNPCATFNGNAYYDRYPDVFATGINPLVHYARFGLSEGRAGRRISKISDIAPCIENSSLQSVLVDLSAAATGEISHIIIIRALNRGGTERSACSYVKAIADKAGLEHVLVVVTDQQMINCPDWLAANTRIINFLDLKPTLTLEERSIMLLELLARVRPITIIGFNSDTFWHMLDCHIEIFRQELSTRLIAYLGGYENYVIRNDFGFNAGPLSRSLINIDMFITDNDRLRDTMIEQYKDSPSIGSKIVSCKKSLTPSLHQSLSLRMPTFNKTKILWAGRLHSLKRTDVLAQIAAKMPTLQFDVYGWVSPEAEGNCLNQQSNIHLKGEYRDFAAIPTEDKALFLHTSKEDGLPNVLLEAAACGLPIIAPDIGAISELIDDTTGWLLPRCDDIDAYVETIRFVLAHPELAKQRALNARAVVNENHKWPAFCERVAKLDIWTKTSFLPDKSEPKQGTY